jgi:hypothetical protein
MRSHKKVKKKEKNSLHVKKFWCRDAICKLHHRAESCKCVCIYIYMCICIYIHRGREGEGERRERERERERERVRETSGINAECV